MHVCVWCATPRWCPAHGPGRSVSKIKTYVTEEFEKAGARRQMQELLAEGLVTPEDMRRGLKIMLVACLSRAGILQMSRREPHKADVITKFSRDELTQVAVHFDFVMCLPTFKVGRNWFNLDLKCCWYFDGTYGALAAVNRDVRTKFPKHQHCDLYFEDYNSHSVAEVQAFGDTPLAAACIHK